MAEPGSASALAGAYDGRGTAARRGALRGVLAGQRSAGRELRYALYERHVRRGARVVCLAGGAGQELGPALQVGATEFRLFDISADSVAEAQRRIESDLDLRRARHLDASRFSAHQADCFAPGFCEAAAAALGGGRDPRGAFDAVACNLALHYAWADEASAAAAIANAAALLAPGGVFFGLAASAEVAAARRAAATDGVWTADAPARAGGQWAARAAFEAEGAGYRFNLQDAGLPDARTGAPWRLFQGLEPLEYGVPAGDLERLAREAGLAPAAPPAEALLLLREPRKLDRLNAEVVRTYFAFAFRKPI